MRENNDSTNGNATPAPAAPIKYLRLRDVMDRLAVSKPTVYRRVRDGGLPKPVRFGGSVRWIASEIEERMAQAAALRDGAAPEARAA